MIETLSISNYALIDNIELSFAPGFNIITGETGAGKSIMLGALSMLFGNRADTGVVRDKGKKSVVEAVFDVSRYSHLRNSVESNDIEWDDSQLILRREITTSGRSRSFVNDVPVSLTVLKEIALQLVDIHSQHQNMLLSNPEYQLGLLDMLLPDKSLKRLYEEAYEQYRQAMRKYQAVKRAIAASKAEEEYFRYQLGVLDQLNPQSDELNQLESERDMLANATEIKTTLSRLVDLLTDGEMNVVGMLKTASNEADKVAEFKELSQMPDRIESLRIDAADIASTFESFNSSIETNGARLEYVEERLSEIYEALRKFSFETIDELIAKREDLRLRIDAIDNGEERLKAFTLKAKAAKKNVMTLAAELTAARKAVAGEFAEMLSDKAMPLGMKNLRVQVSVAPAELSHSGADEVTLLAAFNKNQPLMPVKDTASGGEISRMMLAVKSIIAEHKQLPSIIFDEIDTGVSGDVANRMGDMMKRMSKNIQVISITHLPQIAAKGDAHFKVYKEDSEDATNSYVRPLTDKERIDEIALMVSGDAANEAARETARSLLAQS